MAQDPVTPAPAATPAPIPQRPPTNPQAYATELGLTTEQVVELDRIDREHGEKMKALNQSNPGKETLQKVTREARDAKQAAIKKVLTADQWTAWQVKKNEAREARMQQTQQAAPTHQE